MPPLPDGWRLLPVGGELKIEAADGTIYDARDYFFLPPRALLLRASQLRVEAKETPKAAPVVEGSRAARKRQSEVRKAEKEAARAILIPEKIEWLARKISPDGRPDPEDNVKKGSYKAACMKRGIITKRDYEEIIWRKARIKAGLSPKAKSGPKRQRKK